MTEKLSEAEIDKIIEQNEDMVLEAVRLGRPESVTAALLAHLEEIGDDNLRLNYFCAGVIGALNAFMKLRKVDAQLAEAKRQRDSAVSTQIARGDVLATSGAEARWIEDSANACPACGGSGHKDDAEPIMKLLREAHAVMRATEWHLAPASAVGDGVLEAAAADIEARLGAFLGPQNKETDHD